MSYEYFNPLHRRHWIAEPKSQAKRQSTFLGLKPTERHHCVNAVPDIPSEVAVVERPFVLHIPQDLLDAIVPILVRLLGGTRALLLAGDMNLAEQRVCSPPH